MCDASCLVFHTPVVQCILCSAVYRLRITVAVVSLVCGLVLSIFCVYVVSVPHYLVALLLFMMILCVILASLLMSRMLPGSRNDLAIFQCYLIWGMMWQ